MIAFSLRKNEAFVHNLDLCFFSFFHIIMTPVHELHFLKNMLHIRNMESPYPKLGHHFYSTLIYSFLNLLIYAAFPILDTLSYLKATKYW
jgi:hypothetical protein